MKAAAATSEAAYKETHEGASRRKELEGDHDQGH